MSILNRYGRCHFILAFRAGEVLRAECFVWSGNFSAIMQAFFSFARSSICHTSGDMEILIGPFYYGHYEMVYLQKGLFEQRSSVVFLLFFLFSKRAPHLGQIPYFGKGYLGFFFGVCPFKNWHRHLLHLYFCSPLLGCFPNLTIFLSPYLGHIILKIIKKLTQFY